MARVLVIDDEELSRLAVRQTLEDAGFEVTEARDGREGEALFHRQPADLVITDILMPVQEGVETIFRLRHDFPTLPILAISGGGRTHNLDFLAVARQAGASQVLIKPFNRTELLRAVARCLQPDAGP